MHTCWTTECLKNSPEYHCDASFFDKENMDLPARKVWLEKSGVLVNCNPRNRDSNFTFGMFAPVVTDDVVSAGFIQTYFYCLWWGLKTLRYILCLAYRSILGLFLFNWCTLCFYVI